MRRRTVGLALWLLACVSGIGHAQQSVDLSFDVLRRSGGQLLPSIYWVSLPHVPLIGDVADSGTTLTNKCVGDVDGPSSGDGVLNADDLICSWWTARFDRPAAGNFTLMRTMPSRCTHEFRAATVALGQIRFAGTPFPLEPGAGYEVRVTVRAGDSSSPRNPVTISGDHDPSFAGRTMFASPDCLPGQTIDCCGPSARRTDLVSVPYHTLFRTSFELLCGLENVDWQDADGDTQPDACWDDANGNGWLDPGEGPTGIHDARNPTSVSRHDHAPDFVEYVTHTVHVSFGVTRFTGRPFDLPPGDAYQVEMTRGHQPTVFLPDVP